MQQSADGLQPPVRPAEPAQHQHHQLHVQESVVQQQGLQVPEGQGEEVQLQAELCLQQQQQQQLPLQDRPWQDKQQQHGQGQHVEEQHGQLGHGQQQQQQEQHGQVQQVQEQHVQGLPGAVSDPLPVQPLRLSDIDPEVLAALPWDIQVEVRSQLRVPRGPVHSSSSSGRRGGGGRAGNAGGRRQQGHGSIFKYLKR
jgi:hypothetical protein